MEWVVLAPPTIISNQQCFLCMFHDTTGHWNSLFDVLKTPNRPHIMRHSERTVRTNIEVYSYTYILNLPIHYHCIQCCFPLFIGTVENTIPMSHWSSKVIFTFLHIQQIHHTVQSHIQSTQLPLHPSRSHSLSQPPQLRKAKAISIDLSACMMQASNTAWAHSTQVTVLRNSWLCTFVVGINERPCVDDSW